MKNMYLLIACCLLTACSTDRRIISFGDVRLVSFQTIGEKIPIVPGQLNGKFAWFIVDTGASITMLNAAEATYYRIQTHSVRQGLTELSGLSSVMDLRWKSFCAIQISDLKVQHHVFIAKEMDALFAMIGKQEGKRIAGIIGSDLLARYSMSLDYGRRTLSFSLPKEN